METIIADLVNEAPEHEILPNASKYDLHALRVSWDHQSTTLEIEVSNPEAYKTLRFYGVEQLYVPGGELIGSTFLIIQNLTNCQNRSHCIPAIRVGGISNEGHFLRFWAQSVEELSSK